MKNILCLSLLACLLPISSGAMPINVSFTPSASVVYVGDTFTIDLVADIPDPVLGWGLDVAFNPAILSQVDLLIADPPWSAGFAPDGDGLVGLTFPLPVVGVGVPLATLTFRAIAPGLSTLVASITADDLTEGFPLAPPASPGSFAEVNFTDGSVNVIPVPATFALISLGLAVLGFERHRKQ
jgi:hypothetical protein